MPHEPVTTTTMNINFKTHFPWPGADGKPEPTYFVEKVVHGILTLEPRLPPRPDWPYQPKLHTIRRITGKPRFREGMQLMMTTGPRFRTVPFADTKCTGVQELFIRLELADPPQYHLRFFLNGERLNKQALATLAANDGLTGEQLWRWFALDVISNGPGKYQIVHWTDLKY